ncbi:translin-associated protein X [Silurus asotus]|uniref:Translin-associated protein X n=1 Tax=Silurus asotus TaxID=30991 RepID=A0AAD5FBK0_SILAS|nr:translin-associated protein X [Silurus asotus]
MSKREGEGCARKRKTEECVNRSSSVIEAFRVFQQELDTKHDKYERLVKLSRDITIESKRTIFLLHRVTSAPNIEEVLNEAEVRLDAVRQKISHIAEELGEDDLYQFHKAFMSGIQEYVEAVSFHHFIKHRTLISLEEINARLVFTRDEKTEAKVSPATPPSAAASPEAPCFFTCVLLAVMLNTHT